MTRLRAVSFCGEMVLVLDENAISGGNISTENGAKSINRRALTMGKIKEETKINKYAFSSLPARGEERIKHIYEYANELMSESAFKVSECPVSDSEVDKALKSLQMDPQTEIRVLEELSSTKWWCGKAKQWYVPTFDDSQWNSGELPLIRNHSGPVYFRVVFAAPDAKRVCLEFESVYDEAVIYINGVRVCKHVGYEPFKLDITQFVKEGEENLIAMEVNPELDGGPTGIAGLIKVIGSHDVFISDPFIWTSDIQQDRAELQVEATINNTLNRPFNGRIQLLIGRSGLAGRRPTEAASDDFSVSAHGSSVVRFSLNMKDPALWTTENPSLYLARIKLRDNKTNAWIDDDALLTGIRTVEKGEKLILINGKEEFLKGFSTMFYTEGESSSTYTLCCPSDEWIVKTLLVSKKAGANMLRIHGVGGPPGKRMANGYCPVANFSCATGYSRIAKISDQLGIYLQWTDRNWFYFGTDIVNNYKPKKLERLLPPCLRYVRNSPSIIIWEGANEISLTAKHHMLEARCLLKEGIPKDVSQEKALLRKMRVYFKQYLQLVKTEDPSRLIIPESFMMTLYATPVVKMDADFYRDPQLLLDTHDYTGWYTDIDNLQELSTVWEDAEAPVLLNECGGEAMPEWDKFRDTQSFLVWRNNLGPLSNEKTAAQLGRELEKDEWILSQAWQAYVIEKMYELAMSTGCAGMNICTLADGNATGYHKGVVDNLNRAKLGYLSCARAWE